MVKQGFLNLPQGEQLRVYEAALDEFACKDYESASINQVISRAGISKGSMYHYFANKEDLYTFVLGRAMEQKAQYLATALAGAELSEHDFFAALRTQLEASIQFALEHQRHHLLAVNLKNMPNIKLKRELWGTMRRALEAYIAEMLQVAVTRGEIRGDLNHEFLTQVLTSIFLNIHDMYPDHAALIKRGKDQLTQDMRQLVQFLTFGLKGE